MVFDYCLLPVTDFNITCLKICFRFFFFNKYFPSSFFSFCTNICCFSFSFLFFFSISFPSSFLCLDILKLFSFHSHKLFFFLKLSIRTIKPKRIHFGINLYLSVCSYFMGLFIYAFCVSVFTVYLCHLHQCVSDFFFFLSFPFLCGYFQTFYSNTNSH